MAALLGVLAAPGCNAIFGLDEQQLRETDASVTDGGANDGASMDRSVPAEDASDGAELDAGPVDADASDVPQTRGPRCEGVALTCGPATNENCCASAVILGGTFKRSYDAVDYMDPAAPATVSDYRLDLYEITVGRFRAFVEGYPGTLPAGGSGKNPHNAQDPGWDAAWNPQPSPPDASDASSTQQMPDDKAALVAHLKSCGTYSWTDTAVANENKPITCVNWYEAYAFCIWDLGRLPTEAEWNYAAAAGGDAIGQRVYPWSTPSTSTTVDALHAVYGVSAVAVVGSTSPTGSGRWDHADLAGNVFEWVIDWGKVPYPMPCTDCAWFTASGVKVIRGGGYDSTINHLHAAFRSYVGPSTSSKSIGARCARSP